MTRGEYVLRLREVEGREWRYVMRRFGERHELRREGVDWPLLKGFMIESIAVIRALRAELARVEGES
jgi:hypothetical protein